MIFFIEKETEKSQAKNKNEIANQKRNLKPTNNEKQLNINQNQFLV